MKWFPRRRDFKRLVLLFVVSIFLGVALSSCFSHLYFSIRGTSMEPTIRNGSHVLLLWSKSEPERGDIVIVNVFDDEDKVKENWVKRVVGMPGDTVEVRLGNGPIFVNGFPLEEPYLGGAVFFYSYPIGVWTCGPDEYFVMGDNRPVSKDSRYIGPVRREQIIKILDVWWGITLGSKGVWISN